MIERRCAPLRCEHGLRGGLGEEDRAAQIDAHARGRNCRARARAGRRAPTAPMPALLTRQSIRPNSVDAGFDQSVRAPRDRRCRSGHRRSAAPCSASAASTWLGRRLGEVGDEDVEAGGGERLRAWRGRCRARPPVTSATGRVMGSCPPLDGEGRRAAPGWGALDKCTPIPLRKFRSASPAHRPSPQGGG